MIVSSPSRSARLSLFLLLALLTIGLAQQASAADCVSDFGCTTCRIVVREYVTIAGCAITLGLGGCACFTWVENGSERCQNYGDCQTVWGDGPPPV